MQPVGAEAVPDSPKIRRQTLYKRKRSVLNKAFLREEGGNRRLTEGACVGLKFDVFYSCALSSTRFAGAPSRREPNGKRITKVVPYRNPDSLFTHQGRLRLRYGGLL